MVSSTVAKSWKGAESGLTMRRDKEKEEEESLLGTPASSGAEYRTPRLASGKSVRVGLGVLLLFSLLLFLPVLQSFFPACGGSILSTLRLPLPGAASASAPAAAVLLYAASYAGAITTLKLTVPNGRSGHAHLSAVASSAGCAPNPSWLTLDRQRSILYCADEGLDAPNGSLSSFRTTGSGVLVQLDKIETLAGPVSAVIYGDGGRGLAVAEYSGASFSSYAIAAPDSLALLQAETFVLPHPGPKPDRQDTAHPHEAILDPTGQFLVVPDLGADLVRIFAFDRGEPLLGTAVPPVFAAAPGSGPRHAAFVVTETDRTFMYLLGELANTVTGYEVHYAAATAAPSFRQVYVDGTHGGNRTVPRGAAAAEIHISPDSRFAIISSRMEASFTIPSFDTSDGTTIPSDALVTFAIDHDSGALTAVQAFPAGGMVPRHFSINRAGDLLAVGLQDDGRVVVVRRDVTTGLLIEFIAHAVVPDQVAVWFLMSDVLVSRSLVGNACLWVLYWTGRAFRG